MEAWQLIKQLPYNYSFHAGVKFNNAIYLIAGLDGVNPISRITMIPDGYNMRDVFNLPDNIRQRYLHSACVFNVKIWIAGGFILCPYPAGMRNSVMSSADGKDWRQEGALLDNPIAPNDEYMGSKLVAFGNEKIKIVNLGGNCPTTGVDTNRVISSKDGFNWETHNAEGDKWSPRSEFGCLVYKNKLWVFGGGETVAGDTTGLNDIWYTDDLIHWTRLLENAPWGPRFSFGYCEYDERVWVISGKYATSRGQIQYAGADVWYSRDMFHWVRSFDFPRQIAATYVAELDKKLHVFCGLNNLTNIYRMNLG